MSKTFHFYATLFQFLAMSVGYMLDNNFLFYWAAFWTLYGTYRFFTTPDIKEEDEDAIR